MSKVYLYTARATTAEKVQFDKKDGSVPGISWCQDDSLVSGLLSYEVFRIRHIPIDPSLDPVKTVELEKISRIITCPPTYHPVSSIYNQKFKLM